MSPTAVSPVTSAPVFDPRESTVPAFLAFLAGLGVLLVDATLNPRPGPIAYLVTPPTVAFLSYLRVRPTVDRRRLLALGAWGLVGTTAAGLSTVVVALATRLPRPYEAWELFTLDLGAFVWFVVALAGAFVAAGRTRGWRTTVSLLAGPVAQFAGVVLVLVAVAEDVVLVAVT